MANRHLRGYCLAVLLLGLASLPLLTAMQVATWLLCCSIVMIVATAMTRHRAQQVFLTLTSVAVALCGLEYLGVLSEPNVVLDLDKGLAGPRLAVGWGPEHEGVYRAREYLNRRPVYDVHYTIDGRLFRKVEAGTDGPATAFLGDSFIFGVGVNDSETLPQLFADLEGRKLPVYDLGVGAYSPAQVLATMQLGLNNDLLAKSELFVQFVAPWHAERTACRRIWTLDAPRYERVATGVRFAGVCRAPPFHVLAASAFYRSFIEPRMGVVRDDDIALLVAITKETVRLAREKYHKPMIVYYKREAPFLKRLHWTDDAIIAALRSAGADVLDYGIPGENDARYRIVGDSHPTGLANEIHAKVLASYLRRTYPALKATAILSSETANSQP